ncbi:hypothetical protein L6452_31157 [Arctium lappa]|uniref:Uncharacterized protein n=1 Tax=Arctium lappa TaxID=4217 RepID=A0ACB8ZJ53_ARCLA|nr:hypothetical protein L6452_31157 [Arctium lappa]
MPSHGVLEGQPSHIFFGSTLIAIWFFPGTPRPPLFEGRDVYILGAANVGKSAFINALLKWTLYEQVANAALDCQCLEVAKDNCDHLPLEIDEYELVDPVDILTPLEKSGFWNGVFPPQPTIDIQPPQQDEDEDEDTDTGSYDD